MDTAADRARDLYLEAGRPIEAADLLLIKFSAALRRGEPNEKLRAYTDRIRAEIEDLPATPERETMRAWLLASRPSNDSWHLT